MKNETVKPVVEETMKKFTPDLIATAKTAKSAEELWELAKANNVELTEEEAKTYFEQLSAIGAVSDDELDIVAGGSDGGCGNDEEEEEETEKQQPAHGERYQCPHCGAKYINRRTQCTKCHIPVTTWKEIR